MFQFICTITVPAILLVAQAGPPPGTAPDGFWTGMDWNQVATRLHKVRMQRLQQLLGISEDKAKSIADRWAQLDRDCQMPRQRMRWIHAQVNSILLSPISEDEKNAKIRPLVDQYTLLRQQQQDRKMKFEEDVCASLTPAQEARFMLVSEDIQHALMEAIREQRQESKVKPGP